MALNSDAARASEVAARPASGRVASACTTGVARAMACSASRRNVSASAWALAYCGMALQYPLDARARSPVRKARSAFCTTVSARMSDDTLFFIAPARRARSRAASAESRCATSAALRCTGTGYVSSWSSVALVSRWDRRRHGAERFRVSREHLVQHAVDRLRFERLVVP